jgi:integrase/recombinase XerD
VQISLYRRHNEDCRNRRCTCKTTQTNAKGHKIHQNDCAAIDKHYRRCECSVWFETNNNGKQRQWCSKETTWAAAERKAREIEERQKNGITSPITARTVKEAIELFLTSKVNANLEPDSLYRNELTMEKLEAFCNREGLIFLKDFTLVHLTRWQSQWTVKSAKARRNEQSRVRDFFSFAVSSGMIITNITDKHHWKSINTDDDDNVRAFTRKEYDQIIAAIDKANITDENKARVRALMQLQRWSGLSLVDGALLSKDELQHHNGQFRVVLERQKTGTPINNLIPSWLGEELLAVKNGNKKYVFWSGNSLPTNATDGFDKMYRKVFKTAGVEGSSHDFRHTYAIELLLAGVDIRQLSKALGHSSVTITERYYAKWCTAQQEMLDKTLTKALVQRA